MFRSRGENLRSVPILLFLTVAFFFLEQQDRAKYVRLFQFDAEAVRHGEVWRLVTYQFTQPGASTLMSALSLLITLLLLYMMGTALEEEWGTRHFLTLFLLSTLGSAGIAALLGVPLLGTYFVYFTLLFVFAAAFPQQTFFLFGIPIRVRVLALVALVVLLAGVYAGGPGNLAALGGALVAYAYYSVVQRVRVTFVVMTAPSPDEPPRVKIDTTAMHNAAKHAGIKHALAVSSDSEIDRLIADCDRETVAGVNICPPADYKPERPDGYCIRCEGFAECSARHLRIHRGPRTVVATVPPVVIVPTTQPEA